MATESPMIHDGSQNTLSTANDFRNSTLTGSTLAGPNGSGQFLAVVQSTTVDRTLQLYSSTGSTGLPIYGICQNKPRAGDAVDVGIFGVMKYVAGATIVRGQQLMASATAGGTLIPYSTANSGNVQSVGVALESAVVGQVATGAINAIGLIGRST